MKKNTIRFLTSLFFLASTIGYAANVSFVPDANNQVFRDEVIEFIRTLALNVQDLSELTSQFQKLDEKWGNIYQKSNWDVTIIPYFDGTAMSIGHANGINLAAVLKKGTMNSLQSSSFSKLTKSELKRVRFKVTFSYAPSNQYSFIEYNDEGFELLGSRVAVRKLTTNDVTNQIRQSEEYLLKGIHPKWHGFFKYYDAKQDKAQDNLRTIYSASSLYTLIKLNQWHYEQRLESSFKPIIDFILLNQAKTGVVAGAFDYSYNPLTGKRSCRYVVGTTSKTIFTLLMMNEIYKNNPKYLKAAQKAGDWLLTMVQPDGTVWPVANCSTGKWQYKTKQSLLYSGQVLSALSRLYKETHDERYYAGALKIVHNFLERIHQEGAILGDDYRPANSISSSWVMLSLMDFAKIRSAPSCFSAIQLLANAIHSRQIINQCDVFNNGRYLDAMTASGNGWLNEVFGEYYSFCIANKLKNCEDYRRSIILTSRWLVQNAYNKLNTFNVKNPKRAIGGFITNFNTHTVRTDAVCHGINSLLSLLSIVGPDNQTLIMFDEQPLHDILPLLRAGPGDIS